MDLWNIGDMRRFVSNTVFFFFLYSFLFAFVVSSPFSCSQKFYCAPESHTIRAWRAWRERNSACAVQTQNNRARSPQERRENHLERSEQRYVVRMNMCMCSWLCVSPIRPLSNVHGFVRILEMLYICWLHQGILAVRSVLFLALYLPRFAFNCTHWWVRHARIPHARECTLWSIYFVFAACASV